MNSKERKEGYMERLEWGKRKGKLCHYIIISKIKEKSLKKKRNLASWRKGPNTGEYNKKENVSSLK